jgi:hypothetical protein
MGNIAVSRCWWDVLKVNDLKHSYLLIINDIRTLRDIGNVENIITKPPQNCQFMCFFAITLKVQRVQKWQTFGKILLRILFILTF